MHTYTPCQACLWIADTRVRNNNRDSPETFHFVEANNNVPLQSSFKPQVKVLSRKPMIAKRDPATGISQLALEDEDDEDGAAKKEAQPTSEEIKARQRREREEKQRRYEEARAKIFGESAPSSGASSPSGTVTPPRSEGQHTQRGRGRGRGGGRINNSSNNNNNNGNNNSNNNSSLNQSEPRQQDNRRQNNAGSLARELYDPSYSTKPDYSQTRSQGDAPTRISTPRNEQQQQQAIRSPRGPDGSGMGGFGFARRGAKEG